MPSLRSNGLYSWLPPPRRHHPSSLLIGVCGIVLGSCPRSGTCRDPRRANGQRSCRRQASHPYKPVSFLLALMFFAFMFHALMALHVTGAQRIAWRRAGRDSITGRLVMRYRSSIGALALMAALSATCAGALAFDETKYPDWKGQWSRVRFPGVTGQPSFDQTKSAGAGQQAPLTPEYQAIFEANLKDQAAGGQGTDPTSTCLSPGMPRIMTPYEPMEFVVTPETTHILMQHIHDSRRIYTDGRSFPESIEPSFAGYSIGQWRDPDGSGRYTLLEVETRGFK